MKRASTWLYRPIVIIARKLRELEKNIFLVAQASGVICKYLLYLFHQVTRPIIIVYASNSVNFCVFWLRLGQLVKAMFCTTNPRLSVTVKNFYNIYLRNQQGSTLRIWRSLPRPGPTTNSWRQPEDEARKSDSKNVSEIFFIFGRKMALLLFKIKEPQKCPVFPRAKWFIQETIL